ncbi:predicted protein [Lichtheimia corymbifera JMRC:FSU:9682]|uniref:Uncharacterized protein n=1 Tax=Lichtheimia corymbifera JMRC:FSU:9682 TaxID=1263082 RepID=A0A068SGX0_9FUNG|nr:predicted protein [Lichtheimia corymbifera JMRC:FSU:9682]
MLNGILKNININGKDGFELTYMKAFIQTYYASDYAGMMCSAFSQDQKLMDLVSSLLPSLASPHDTTPDEDEDEDEDDGPFNLFEFLKYAEEKDCDDWCIGYEDLPPSLEMQRDRSVHMDPSHYSCLFEYYKLFYHNVCSVANADDNMHFVSDAIWKTPTIHLLGQKYRSQESPRTFRGAHIQAYHCTGGPRSSEPTILRPGVVQYYFTHVIKLPVTDETVTDPQPIEHTFAFVRWFNSIAIQPPTYTDAKMTRWKNEFLPINKNCIVPNHRIYSPIAITKWLDGDIVAIPLPRKIAGG